MIRAAALTIVMTMIATAVSSHRGSGSGTNGITIVAALTAREVVPRQ